MHISDKNRFPWQIKVTHPLAAIIYNRCTYPWRFTRVPSVCIQVYTINRKYYLQFIDDSLHGTERSRTSTLGDRGVVLVDVSFK